MAGQTLPHLDFLSASCNRRQHVAAWGARVLAYGADTSVALRKPTDETDNGVKAMLVGHTGLVNTVAIVSSASNAGGDVAIVSGGADSSVRVWLPGGAGDFDWRCAATCAHSAIVTVVACSAVGPAGGYAHGHFGLAAATTDARITLWRVSLDSGEAVQEQQLILGAHPAVCLDLAVLPGGAGRVLASGAVDSKVALHVAPVAEGDFTLACALRGHTDWVSAAHFAAVADDSNGARLLLATGSQDRSIRLWAIAERGGEQATRARGVDGDAALLEEMERLMERHETARFSCGGREYSVQPDALLSGHEDWVRSVAWQPRPSPDAPQPLCLLSSSIDKSVVVWRPDPEAGVWVSSARLGDVGGQNNFGFFGACFGPDGRAIIAHGHNGALHLWRAEADEQQQQQQQQQRELWSPRVICGGHFGAVEDAAWDPSGTYLLTTSADQTTRIFGEWRRAGQGEHPLPWYELSRAQVHGHDMACAAFTGNHRFVSGAEEKVLRVFDAPQGCLDTLRNVVGVELPPPVVSVATLTARTPALGLSNKAVIHGGKASRDEEEGADADEDVPAAVQTLVLGQPPFEEHLMQSTLWAESEKLYGHGYELFSVAADHAGEYLASASRATQAEFASIRIWRTSTWLQATELVAHSLTTTQMAFSPDDKWLLSVSRDRSFALSVRTDDEQGYRVAFVRPKAHARIIWSCAWAPSGTLFATASRDAEVRLWRPDAPNEPIASVALPSAATAVAFAPYMDASGRMLLAVGTERVQDASFFCVSAADKGGPVTMQQLQADIAPAHFWAAASSRLAWRCPRDKRVLPESARFQLASVAGDGTVRIASIDVVRALHAATA